MTQFGEQMAGTLTSRADSSPTPMGGQNMVLCVGDRNANASVEENASPTLKAGGDGGIHSAVAYNDCLTPWDVQSKRVFAEDGCGPTLQAGTHEAQNIQPVVMASGHSHAEIGMGGLVPTLTAHNQKDAPVLVAGRTANH